jgi:hypothetical protein
MLSGHTDSPGAIIDVYWANPDYSNAGEGEKRVNSGVADNDGHFSIRVPLDYPADFTAIATDVEGNSSAYATNIPLPLEVDVEDDAGALPTELSLSQNFPNPFNPVTTIQFSLPIMGFVDLRVFNALGREVRQLVADTRAAGEYTVIWDGRTNDGITASSGVYFYRLVTGETTIQRKMVLLK